MSWGHSEVKLDDVAWVRFPGNSWLLSSLSLSVHVTLRDVFHFNFCFRSPSMLLKLTHRVHAKDYK